MKTKLHQIKASAGSGKTYTLTSQFIDALENCGQKTPSAFSGCVLNCRNYPASFGGILAITFTNLAAAEMRERVITRLKEIALGREEGLNPVKAAKWLDILLGDMDNLNIRTIDSLLQMIVRSAALDLGLHPDFEPVFDSRDAMEPYMELFLARALNEGDEARKKLYAACKAFFDYSDSKSFSGGKPFLDNFYKFVDSILKQEFQDLAPAGETQKNFDDLCKKLRKAAQALLASGKELDGEKWNKNSLKQITAIASGEFGKCASSSASGQPLKKDHEMPEEMAKAFEKYHALVTRLAPYYEMYVDALKYAPLVEITQNIAKAYYNNMAMDGLCPSSLIPILARDALASENGVSDAICRLGNRLTHFMIDEFQDTSRQQWDAIKPLVENALASGGSLIWVGDIKQSIYGWRGGDPSLFDGIIDELKKSSGADGIKYDDLPKNWRSLPEIVNFNNRLFLPLSDKTPLPDEPVKEEEPAAKESASKKKKAANTKEISPKGCFAEVLVKKSIPGSPPSIVEETTEKICLAFKNTEQKIAEKWQGKGGYVSIKPVPAGTQENPAPELQAELGALAQEIGKRRPYSDIMILCRSKEQCALAAETLISLDIPVITENSLKLSAHSIVRQAIAFLEFLDNPDNDLAFWNVITGSLTLGHSLSGALEKQELEDWAARDRKKKGLYRQFRNDFYQVWQNLLQPFYRRAGFFTPYDTIREWFDILDVEKRFPEDATFTRRLLEIIHLAEAAGMNSIPSFLAWWHEKGTDEKAPMPEKMNAVRIMTIHKAKGLESPVAIVPWTKYVTSNYNPPPIVTECDGQRVVVPLKKYCGLPYYKKQANQLAENLNLLYVAFTRAKEELYIFSPPPPEKGPDKSLLGQLLNMAGMASPQTFGKPLKTLADGQDTGAKSQEPDKTISENRCPKWPISDYCPETWYPLHWCPDLKIFFDRDYPDADKIDSFSGGTGLQAAIAHDAENIVAGFVAQDMASFFTSADRGTFLHFCLENMPLEQNPEKAARNAFEYGLAHAGIAVPEDPELRESLLAALTWFAKLAPCRHWLGDGLPEQPIMNEKGQILRVDNMVRESFGTLIIDYKSGGIYPKHIDQLQDYIHCISQCKGFEGKIYGLLVYLDKKSFRLVEADKAHAPVCEIPKEVLA